MFTFPVAHFGGELSFTIPQSIRFNDDDSAFLTRTPGSEGNRRTFTFSTWVKFATLKADAVLFSSWVSSGASSYQILVIDSDFRMRVADHSANYLITTQKFRDVGAWYHVVWRSDTTDSSAADRYQLYINGARVTAFDTESQPSLNFQGSVNQTQPHYLGRNGYNLAMVHSDLYQAETHFIDGTALDCTAFGEFDSITGQWIPKKYTNAAGHGTNGFHITGADSSDLGADQAGSNDFTSSGLTAADRMLDTPTNNFCVLSPIDKFGSGLTLSDGNLRAVPAASAYGNNHGTFYIDSGKWVFECKHTSVFGEACGWSPSGELTSGSSDRGYFMFVDGRAYDNTTNTGTKGASLAAGDFRYVFYDADAQAMWFAHVDVSSSNALVYDNSATKAEIEAGTTTNAVFTNIPAGFWAPGIWMDTSGVIEVNFGQSAFATTSDLPSGFNTLSAANLSDPTISDPSLYFQTTLYTGNTSTQSINQSGNSTFQPDWAWIKARGQAYDHALYDAVRGATKEIKSNATDTEATITNGLTAFESDGFALGDRLGVNQSSQNYVAWQWKANGSGSSNTDGSVTSTVSANTTAGFSICKFNPGGNVNMTFGHGLGVAPRLVIVKNLEDATNWQVLHLDQGVGNKIFLNATNAAASDANMWQNTAPTSTVVSMGTAQTTNEDVIAYCFAEIPSYSKISSYVGNGLTDGPFVATNFKPAWLLIKRATSGTGNWDIFDNQRDPINPADAVLDADANSAEATFSTIKIDLLSNGFKIRGTQSNINASGSTYIYMAFAETPFKTATAR